MATTKYSYKEYTVRTIDLVIKLSKPVIVRHPPPYFVHGPLRLPSMYVTTGGEEEGLLCTSVGATQHIDRNQNLLT